jgi:hypothetical protein
VMARDDTILVRPTVRRCASNDALGTGICRVYVAILWWLILTASRCGMVSRLSA